MLNRTLAKSTYLVLMLFPLGLFAQLSLDPEIRKPSVPHFETGKSYAYTLKNGIAGHWEIDTNVGEIVNSDAQNVTVKWTKAGSHRLKAFSFSGIEIADDMTWVQCSAPTFSYPPLFKAGMRCNGEEIYYDPSDLPAMPTDYYGSVTYYWQSSRTGKSLAHSSERFQATYQGKAYLRGYNTVTNCWLRPMDESEALIVNNNQAYTVNYPALSQSPTCLFAVLSYNPAHLQNNDGRLAYYWQDKPNGTSMEHSGVSYEAREDGKFYFLRAYDTQGGCWVDNEVMINAQLQAMNLIIPKAPKVLGLCEDGVINLEINNQNTSEYTFYFQSEAFGEDLGNAQAILNATEEGDYFVRAKHHSSGCWTWASTGVYVSPNAAIEQPPSDVASTNLPTNETGEITTGTVNRPTQLVADNGNYVRHYKMRRSDVTTINYDYLNNLPKEEVGITTKYMDGLGRPSQVVQKAASPTGKDIVSVHKYDHLGREQRQYLPFASNESTGSFKANGLTDQYTYYQTANNQAHTDWAFSETEFDTSPMNRAVSSAKAGKDWVGSGRKNSGKPIVYTQSMGVRVWKIDDQHQITTTDTYEIGTLVITEAKDEHGNLSYQYTDLMGRTILTKAQLGEDTYVSTYYVYDQYGLQRAVLPPKATKLLAANGWEWSEEVESLVFRYRYDYRKRKIATQLPSQEGENKVVYDKQDRAVLTQSPKQAAGNQWNYTKYDGFGRPVITGIATIHLSHEQLMAQVSGQSQTIRLVGDQIGQDAFPKIGDAGVVSIEDRSMTFYDSYEGIDLNEYAFQPVIYAGFTSPQVSDWALIGKTVASKVKVLDDSNTWLWTVNHFDKKGRVIQVVADNHLGGKDVLTTQLDDFTSRVEKTYQKHAIQDGANTQTIITLRWFEYDHRDRVKKSYMQLNDQAPELLAEFDYNELGQVVIKKLGDNLQKVDYAYNLHGWLTRINGLDLDNSILVTIPKIYGGWSLSYNEGFSKKQFNGNISGAKWVSARDGETTCLWVSVR